MTSPLTPRARALIDAGVALLEESGPEALSTRKIAMRAGTTTMAVYTEFGSVSGIFDGIVMHGFRSLASEFADTTETDDPISDLLHLVDRYRGFAVRHPHLYRLMYAVGPVGGHVRDIAEPLRGSEAFAVHQRRVQRAVRSLPDDPPRTSGSVDLAVQVWASVHGMVIAELSGVIGLGTQHQDSARFLHEVVRKLITPIPAR